MAGTLNRTIYKGNVERRVLMQPGHILPNLEKGQSLASFTQGIRSFTFGTPLLLEAGILPSGPGYEYKISDYICAAHAVEQPKVYGSYFGGTYGRSEPEFTEEEKTAMLTALNNINMEYTVKNITMENDIKFLGIDSDAYSRIWDEVYSDPEKYHAVRNVLLNAELCASRTLAYSVFTPGAVAVREINKAFDRTQNKIKALPVSDKTRSLMLSELEGIRIYCDKHQDSIAHVILLDEYNNAIANVSHKNLGVERGRFMDILSEEISQVKWRRAVPEISYIHKDELRDYFDKLNETSPDGMVEANEKIYDELQNNIQNDVKVIHSYENPYKPYSPEALDNINDEDSPMPFMILYSITASNDAADRHEASITVSDGQSCFFEKISMDSDGSLSSARANVGISGVIADLDKEADRDIVSDRKEELQVVEKIEAIQEKTEVGFVQELDITEIIAVAPDGETIEEEESFFEEI